MNNLLKPILISFIPHGSDLDKKMYFEGKILNVRGHKCFAWNALFSIVGSLCCVLMGKTTRQKRFSNIFKTNSHYYRDNDESEGVSKVRTADTARQNIRGAGAHDQNSG